MIFDYQKLDCNRWLLFLQMFLIVLNKQFFHENKDIDVSVLDNR